MESPTDDADRHLHEAWNWIERGRYVQAETAIARGLESRPDDSDLTYAASYCAYLQDDHHQARQLAETVLGQNPEHVGSRRLLAGLASDQGDYVEAEKTLLDLLGDYPAEPSLIADYGMLMLRTLNLGKAEKLAAKALQIDPENERALLVAAMCDLVNGRGNADQQALADLLEHHPNERSTLSMLIRALVDANRLAEAQRVAEGLVQVDPRAQENVDLVRELRYARHWSLRPLWPLQRFGWGGVIGLYVLIVFGTRALRGVVPPTILGVISITYLVYCIYSWVWPSVLRRLMLKGVKR